MTAFARDFKFVQRQLAHPPYWAQEKLLNWSDIYPISIQNFITHAYWTETGSVNVFRIVGTDHPDYAGQSWLDFLSKAGKRMPKNLTLLQENPDYYLYPCQREPRMLFTTLDGLNYYVSSDGNHRSCIARFFLFEQDKSQLHNVCVTHYHVDQRFYAIYQELEKLRQALHLDVRLRPGRHACGREDTAGWKLDRFEPYLVWEESGKSVHLDFNAALGKLRDLEGKNAVERFMEHNRSQPLLDRLRHLFKQENRT